MKESSVLNVLMYIFKYHMHDNCELDTQHEKLVTRLEDAGFQRPVILRAFGWLANLTLEDKDRPIKTNVSLRVFSEYECDLIDEECRGFMIFLEQEGILNPTTRELVINQILELESEGIDLSLIKWVVMMVLFNQNDHDNLAYMEFLLLDESVGGLQ